MSEMSDATNDTTRTARALELANQTTPWTGPQLSEIDGMLRQYATLLEWLIESGVQELDQKCDALSADLDRLAGPPCDHPPCKGARAIEHAEKYSYVDWKAYVDLKPYGRGVVIDGQPQTHPDWPEGEAWLRARSAK